MGGSQIPILAHFAFQLAHCAPASAGRPHGKGDIRASIRERQYTGSVDASQAKCKLGITERRQKAIYYSLLSPNVMFPPPPPSTVSAITCSVCKEVAVTPSNRSLVDVLSSDATLLPIFKDALNCGPSTSKSLDCSVVNTCKELSVTGRFSHIKRKYNSFLQGRRQGIWLGGGGGRLKCLNTAPALKKSLGGGDINEQRKKLVNE